MKFKEFRDAINNTENNKINELITNFEIKDEEIEEWIDNIYEHGNEIDINKMPYVLDSLYKSNDKLMFSTFCMLLEVTYNKLPFITRLESIPIFKGKYQMLIETLLIVFTDSYNGIADCMANIILRNDPKGELFNEEELTKLITSINKKLKLIKEYIEKHTEIHQNIYNSLEILFDLTTYIHNEQTLELLKEFINMNINNISKVYLIKTIVINKFTSVPDKYWLDLLNDPIRYHNLAYVLTSIGYENIVPKQYVNIELSARGNMLKWLLYPNELGKSPDTIELVNTLEKDDSVYYIYKFTSDKFNERGEMIGIAGGFDKETLTTKKLGYTFSKFETITDNYIVQAEDIINMIKEHWQNRINN